MPAVYIYLVLNWPDRLDAYNTLEEAEEAHKEGDIIVETRIL